MTPTEQYIEVLTHLKSGELGLLREHAGQGLDESVDGFDLFAGLWWPLAGKKSVGAPAGGGVACRQTLRFPARRTFSRAETLAGQLGRCQKDKDPEKDPVAQRFDSMLTLPIENIEPSLHWALDLIASKDLKLDWVRLTNDLSIWERETTRLKWAKEFLKSSKMRRALARLRRPQGRRYTKRRNVMLIEIHAIQNHSPANLNRDDLGAPKTCFFGGVLRSRISSQCLKRSIRMSDEFKQLLGGVRTRRLAQLIAPSGPDSAEFKKAIASFGNLRHRSKRRKKERRATTRILRLTTKVRGWFT